MSSLIKQLQKTECLCIIRLAVTSDIIVEEMAWQTKSCKVKILLLCKCLWFIFDHKIFIRFENISSIALKKKKNNSGNIVKAALQIWE